MFSNAFIELFTFLLFQTVNALKMCASSTQTRDENESYRRARKQVS